MIRNGSDPRNGSPAVPMVGIGDGPLSRPRGPHQSLKTSSIQSDHSALRQIMGSQRNNGIACLPFVGTKSAGGPDAESALVPLYVGTPAVPSHLIHNILRCRENCDENTLARIQWGLVYAP